MRKEIQTRAEFQQLAEERLIEAKVLLDAGKWAGAYYLAGYAVELALKSCIIKRLMATDAFPERDFSRNCYTHAVEKLVELAGVDDARKLAMSGNREFGRNWAITKDWSEGKRYHFIGQNEAEDLYNAVAAPEHGVLPWVKTYW